MTNVGINSTKNYQYKSNNVANNTTGATNPASKNVQPSETSSKNGLSNDAKLSIGLGLTALAAAGIYLATQGRARNTKQLVEFIEFKEAKTLEEAKKYALDNYGIKLELGDNLFAANFINESCANVLNKMKGKAIFPKKIMFDSNIDVEPKASGSYNYVSNIISIRDKNPSGYNYVFYKVFNETLKTKQGYAEYIKQLESGNSSKIILNMRNTIYHELGHCNHQANCKDVLKMRRLKELQSDGIKDTHYIDEFMSKYITIASKVSDYAKESPAEFVAETYAKMIEGIKFDDDVMALYKKYSGPTI